MRRTIKLTSEDRLEDMGMHQVTLDELMYPKENRSVKHRDEQIVHLQNDEGVNKSEER